MSANVKHNAESAKNASMLAEAANQTASRGGKVVEQAVGAMTGIESSTQKITDIISVIDKNCLSDQPSSGVTTTFAPPQARKSSHKFNRLA